MKKKDLQIYFSILNIIALLVILLVLYKNYSILWLIIPLCIIFLKEIYIKNNNIIKISDKTWLNYTIIVLSIIDIIIFNNTNSIIFFYILILLFLSSVFLEYKSYMKK